MMEYGPYYSIRRLAESAESILKLLDKFQKQGKKLVSTIGKWSDSDLDKYLLPHPLLGKMTIRELLLWTTYHNYHHLNNLKENYL